MLRGALTAQALFAYVLLAVLALSCANNGVSGGPTDPECRLSS